MNTHQNHLLEKFKEVQKLTDEELSARLWSSQFRPDSTKVNYCSNGDKATLALNQLFENMFDAEDREDFNFLIERKPISYDFRVSNRKRSEAIVAVLLCVV